LSSLDLLSSTPREPRRNLTCHVCHSEHHPDCIDDEERFPREKYQQSCATANHVCMVITFLEMFSLAGEFNYFDNGSMETINFKSSGPSVQFHGVEWFGDGSDVAEDVRSEAELLSQVRARMRHHGRTDQNVIITMTI